MSDQFTVVIIVAIVVWLAITVAFGVVIVKMIRVNGSRRAAGSGIPKTLEHRGDPAAPHTMTARASRRAKAQEPGQLGTGPTGPAGPSA